MARIDNSLVIPAATVQVIQTGDGEVSLPPVAGSEFNGNSLPTSWQTTNWPVATTGTVSVADGVLTVDGARAGTQALYSPGRSLEFNAIFTGDPFQHVGLATDFSANSPWAIFSTFGGGDLYARTSNGSGSSIDTLLADGFLGGEHLFSVQWNSGYVTYLVDGVQVADHAIDVTANLRPLVGDFATGGGSVIVNSMTLVPPGYDVEFAGTSLPSDWMATTLNQVAVSGGQLVVNGTMAGTQALYAPGRSLEFAATFSGDPFQHAGFAVDNTVAPWAIFSTASGGQLFARTNSGATSIDTPLGASWLGAAHLFRIDWGVSTVSYSIDGSVVATHSLAIATAMRATASDFTPGDGSLSVDWLRLSPYTGAGTFSSRVLDAGSSTAWGTASWTSAAPAGTGLAFSVRVGNTPTPDAAWTSFQTVSGTGGAIAGNGRYLQYRAALSSTDAGQSPTLASVTITTAGAAATFVDTTAADFAQGSLGSGVLANDGNSLYDPLTAILVSGPAHGTLSLSSDGSFAYAPNTGFSGNDAFVYQAQSPDGTLSDPTTVTIQILAKETPVITWSNPAAITYGTALSGTQLNATGSVPGTMTYSKTGGTVLAVGTHAITATFTPSDMVNYNVASASVNLTVNAAPLIITAVNASMPFGGPLPTLSAQYTGFVNGDTAASLATQPVLSTTATVSSSVGTYAITAAGASSTNYAITYVSGALTVTAPAYLAADPLNPGDQALYVSGTAGNDLIVVTGISGSGGTFLLAYVGPPLFTNGPSFDAVFTSPVSRIVVHGQAGNDDISVIGLFKAAGWLYGDDGNDRMLVINGGNNVFVGGSGNDLLVGGRGRDMMIGGAGADRMIGNGGDDILVGGTTAFDNTEAALGAIMAEWTSSHSFATRIANLTNTGSELSSRLNGSYYLLNGGDNQTVFNDSSNDTMSGSSGSDWLFAGTTDNVTDLSTSDREFIFGS